MELLNLSDNMSEYSPRDRPIQVWDIILCRNQCFTLGTVAGARYAVGGLWGFLNKRCSHDKTICMHRLALGTRGMLKLTNEDRSVRTFVSPRVFSARFRLALRGKCIQSGVPPGLY